MTKITLNKEDLDLIVNAHWLDTSRKLDIYDKDAFLDKIIEHLDGYTGHKTDLRNCVEAFVVNALMIQRYNPGGFLIYGRHQRFYDKLNKYKYDGNHAGVKLKFVELVDALAATQLAENFADTSELAELAGKNVASRCRPTKKFWDTFFPNGKADTIKFNRKHIGIVVKNADKSVCKEIKSSEKSKIRSMRKKLEAYNDFMAQQEIRYTGNQPSVNQNNTQLYRVFNDGSIKNYGRLYGGFWETMPATERQHILINGEPTIELDLRAQGLQILAALQGGALDVTKDPRLIKPFSPEVTKVAAMMAVFSNSRRGAHANTMKDLEEYDEKHGTSFAAELPDYATYKSLVTQFIKNNPILETCLFRGNQNAVQRIDSDLCMTVLTKLNKKKIAVLPIHDSFIVPQSKGNELREAVIEAYKAHPLMKNTIPYLK